MTLIDVLILGNVGYAFSIFVRRRFSAGHPTNSAGFVAILSGLVLIGLFYAFDLLAMHLLPMFVSKSTSMAMMTNLHLHYNWTVTVVGLGAIAIGFSVSSQNTFDVMKNSKKNEELLKTSLENMGHGFCVFDADRKLVAYNKKFLHMARLPEGLDPMGLDHEQILRHRAANGVYGEEELQRRILAIKNSHTPKVVECIHPDGTIFIYQRKPMPEGGFVSTFIDITERKRSEEELAKHVLELEDTNSRFEKQGQELAELAEDLSLARDEADNANKTKSEFLTNMSHELRTPLNAIIGFSEIIKNELLGPVGTPTYRDYAKDVFDSGHHLLQLINDLLDLSKIEAGRLELDEKDFDVVQVIQSCQKLVSEQAKKGKVELISDLPDSLPMLHFDELKFKQIILNLLSNAVKFTPEGGTVTTKAWLKPERGHYFQVTDTGIGIAQEDIPRALSSFGQIDSELAQRHKGTGLGLPLCKELAELGGGVMEMQSEIGKGTTVTVHFPKERIAQDPQVKRPSSAAV